MSNELFLMYFFHSTWNPPVSFFFKQRVFWGAILKRPGGEPCVFPSQAVLQLRGSNCVAATPQLWRLGLSLPIGSMYSIFTYIYHKNQPNVGKYTIHGSYRLWDSCGLMNAWLSNINGDIYIPLKNRQFRTLPIVHLLGSYSPGFGRSVSHHGSGLKGQIGRIRKTERNAGSVGFLRKKNCAEGFWRIYNHQDVWDMSWNVLNLITLPATNIAPENRPSQKVSSIPTIHFQVLC